MLVLDAEVRRQPHDTGPEPPGQDAFRRDPLGRLLDREAERLGLEADEVRVDGRRVDRQPRRCQSLRESLRACVVLSEPLDVVVERVEGGGGHDPRLPHRTAEQELAAPRFPHRLARAGEDRSERTAEPFGETERDGVCERAVLRSRHAARDGRVHQPGAVEMDGEAELARGARGRSQLVERPQASARAPVRLLENDDARGLEIVGSVDGGSDLVGCDPSAVARQPAHDEPRVHGRPARLEDERVRPLLRDQLAPALAQAVERDLVGHGRGRQEQRLLLPEQLGGTTLQLVDGRVLAQLLVPHLRGGHRGTHLRRRDRRRVRAKVDHG